GVYGFNEPTAAGLATVHEPPLHAPHHRPARLPVSAAYAAAARGAQRGPAARVAGSNPAPPTRTHHRRADTWSAFSCAPHSQALPRAPATMPMRMDVTPPARNRSLATVRTVGAVVGAALAGALLAIFVVDRRIHIGDVGNDSLVPWWLFVGWGLVFYALYWVGFRYLLRTLRRNDAANKQLIAQLTAANENLELA